MIPNQKLDHFNYYSQPKSYSVTEFTQTEKAGHRPHPHPHKPCPPPPYPGLQAAVAAPWEKTVAEHNLDKNAHPHLIKLFKDKTSLYFCKDKSKRRIFCFYNQSFKEIQRIR